MADPILTDFFRTLVIFHHESGLPEDVFVNSWAFRNDGAIGEEAVATNITSVLEAFYMGVHGTSSALMNYYPSTIDSIEFRTYDLGQPPPRIPIITQPTGTWAPGTGTALPFEVAVCLSMVAGRNQPRSRGRLFIGPLKNTAADSSAGLVHPAGALITAMVDAADNVLTTSENVSWHIISHADAAAKEVTGGWVDNAWDTVRRRGLGPSGRSQWGAYTS